jgi:CO/xanthine dehydrogenase FAD-binding subunit
LELDFAAGLLRWEENQESRVSGTNYLAAATIAEAVSALKQDGAKLLAGGTDLLVQMRSGRVRPKLIVDIKRITGMTDIHAENGGFVIGAAASGASIGEHSALKKTWPGVVEAANLIGSTLVQGRASLGGNLCNASPAADSVPALIAAGAICVVEGPNGRREVPAEKVQVGPGQTSLAPDEVLVAFRLPSRPARSADAYLRLIPRTEMDIAVVGAGVSLTLDASGICKSARVALGAVAPTAVLVEEAGAALAGSVLDERAMVRMDEAVRAACKPITDKRGTVEYRTKIACVLARRAVAIAKERAAA